MESLITLLGPIVTLILLSVVVSVGLIQLALSRSPYHHVIPVASINFLPVLLVVSLAAFGYFGAKDVDWRHGYSYLSIACIVSIVVALREWRLLREVFTSAETFWAVVSGVLLLAPFLYLNSTAPFAYNYLGNGEFLNYALLASATLNGADELGGFLNHHRTLRYGQDVFLAFVSGLFGKSPIEMVHAVSGYLLFSYGTVVGFVIVSLFKSRYLSVCLIGINAAMSLPIFNFNASFLSSTVVLPASIMFIAFSTSDVMAASRSKPEFNREYLSSFCSFGRVGEALLVALFVVFSAITYPEFGVPVIITAIGISGALSIKLRGVTRPLIALTIGVGLIFLGNNGLVVKAFNGFFGQLGSGGGWNIFGDPRQNLGLFLTNIIGLTHPFTQQHLISFSVITYILMAILAGMICLSVIGLNKTSHGGRIALLVWFAMALTVLLIPIFSGSHWYPAIKYFSQYSIGLVLVIGFSFSALVDSPRIFIKWFSRVGLSAILMSYVASNANDLAYVKQNIETLSFEDWVFSLSAEGGGALVIFKEREGEVIWFAELVANHADIKLIPLTLAQADRLARRGSSPISRDSGCLVDGPPPLYDFRGWPYKVRSFIAAVDVNSPKDKILTSDRGFALAVDKQHTIGQTGRFRFDKIETGSDTNISFPAGSWAIDGIWSACLDSKTGDRAVSLTFDVPATLLNAGPVKVLLTRGGSETSVLIANAGRYTLEVAPSESHSQSSNIISVRTLATWTPRDADSNSGDLRRLGVNVVSIKQIGI